MNRLIKLPILITAILLSFSTYSFSADKEVYVTKLVDAGPDGDERFYTVYCSDGKSAALVKRYTIDEVCTRPSYAEKDICRNWTVDEAAAESCK